MYSSIDVHESAAWRSLMLVFMEAYSALVLFPPVLMLLFAPGLGGAPSARLTRVRVTWFALLITFGEQGRPSASKRLANDSQRPRSRSGRSHDLHAWRF